MPALPIIAIAILLVVAVVMLIIRNYVPRYGYTWLAAVIGAFLAWLLLIVSKASIPQTIQLKILQVVVSPADSPVLLIDDISWVFAVSLATILLSVLLTDVARASETDWSAWTANLILSAFGLFSVFAGNPLTLLLAWVAVDFAELLVMFWHVQTGSNRERVVFVFSTRMAGIFLLLWAWITSKQYQPISSFETMPQGVTVLILLAAWIRLGIIPIQLPQLHEASVRRSLGTLASLISAASCFVLIVRTANVGVLSWQVPYLLLLTGIVAFYGSFSWFFSRNELAGRPYWIIALSALSVASAVRVQPSASLAWGLTAILSGSVLFLYSARRRLLVLLTALGLINILILPGTLSWNGSNLFISPLNPVLVIYLLAQALLAAGYYRHARLDVKSLTEVERWVWVVYTIGLGLISLFQIPVALDVNIKSGALITPINLSTLWPGLVVLGLAGLVLFLRQRGRSISPQSQARIRTIFSLEWFYQSVGYLYQFIGRIISIVTYVLEGEGGVLWVLLWLALLFVLISQGNLEGI